MVIARLHIICGNCGSNNDFKSKTIEDDEAYYLCCLNCGTLHDLSDNADIQEGWG